MKVQIRYEEGVKFVAQARMHQAVIDQPKEKGGSDAGMNPLEFFLTSLGSCVALYAKRYYKDTNLDFSGLTVDVESELSPERPFRFTDIKLKVKLKNDIGDRREPFLRFIKNCPIHNTLAGQPNIDIDI
ncbi:MAG: OsmC family protein [Candidatus Omnitrophota bacterium]